MNDWTPICRVDDIPKLGARCVRRDAGADVAVFRAADDKVFALLDRCPHKGGPLSQGIVFGHAVACPLHNWTIGLDDAAGRRALWERLQFSLDGEPDPWVEFEKARVDARQFEPLAAGVTV